MYLDVVLVWIASVTLLVSQLDLTDQQGNENQNAPITEKQLQLLSTCHNTQSAVNIKPNS